MKHTQFFMMCLFTVAVVFFNAACNNNPEKEPAQQDKEQITTKSPDKTDPAPTQSELPTPEQLAERAKTAEEVKKAFEANYRIEKTATGYSLGGLKFNDGTSNAVYAKNGWTFIINQKEKGTIEITAPGVGTATFKFDNFGNLEPLIE